MATNQNHRTAGLFGRLAYKVRSQSKRWARTDGTGVTRDTLRGVRFTFLQCRSITQEHRGDNVEKPTETCSHTSTNARGG